MGIKDDGKDKDELKNLVENSVEKKLKEFSKDTEKNREKDKKEILKELKQRDEKGLNTLAQKFEMLKLKAEQANKKQSKNPLVELSDKNLKWLSEHTLANQNPEDMGKGLAQNIVKTFTKSHGNEEKEGATPLGTLPMAPQEDESASNDILKSKISMEEKIDEIHKFVTKGILKEQKNSSNILSKGLDGLTKGMKTTQKVLKDIGDKAKQFAMVGLVGLAGLLAIVGWFKEDGPKKLAKSIQDGILDGIIKNLPWNKENDTKDLDTSNYTDKVGGSINSAILEKEDYGKYLTENKDKFTGISGSTDFSSKSKDGSYTRQGKEFNVGNMTPVLAPIDGTILDVKSKVGSLKGGQERMYFDFTLYGKGGASSDSGMTQNVVQLKFENILNIKVHNKQQVKMGQLLGFADGSFKITQTLGNSDSGKQILDNYESMVNKEKNNNWKNTIKTTTENLKEKDYDDINKMITDEVIEDQFQNRSTSKYTNGLTNVGNKISNKNKLKDKNERNKFLKGLAGEGRYHIGDKVEGVEDGYTSEQEQQTEVPKADVTQVSENKNKLNEQSKELQIQQAERDLFDPITDNKQIQGQQTQNSQRGTVVQSSTPNEAKRPEEFKSLDGVLPGRKTIGP